MTATQPNDPRAASALAFVENYAAERKAQARFTLDAIAQRVAPAGVLDAERLGVAAAALPPTHEAARQELKLLWHILVRFGSLAARSPTAM